MKFKIGQMVEVVDRNGMAASLGATAVVTMESYIGCMGDDAIDVVWKTNSNNQMDGEYRSSHFKPLIKKNEQLLFSFMD